MQRLLLAVLFAGCGASGASGSTPTTNTSAPETGASAPETEVAPTEAERPRALCTQHVEEAAGFLLAAWGSSDDDVFVVGRRGQVLHFDGQGWRAEVLPGEPNLTAVWGSGPDDVHAVGGGGTIAHYDGQGWQLQQMAGIRAFHGVWAAGPDFAVAVGTGGCALYDGTSWRDDPTAPEDHLWGVWGRSSDEVYAVGTAGQIYLYEDDEWKRVGERFPREDYGVLGRHIPNFNAIVGTEDGWLFAVGNSGARAWFDGSSWHAQTGPGTSLRAVVGRRHDAVTAVGANGRISTFDGEIWHERVERGVGWLNGLFERSDGQMIVPGESSRVWSLEIAGAACPADPADTD